jgi:hypothetical protein
LRLAIDRRTGRVTGTHLLAAVQDILGRLLWIDICCLGGVIEIILGDITAIAVSIVGAPTATTHAHSVLLSVFANAQRHSDDTLELKRVHAHLSQPDVRNNISTIRELKLCRFYVSI